MIDYNRFLYVRGNPLKYSDPSGHYTRDEIMQHYSCSHWACVEAIFDHQNGGDYGGLYGWLAILQDAQDGDEVGAWNPLKGSWVTGLFQKMDNGRIFIRQGDFDTEERTFALVGGRYPATEQFIYGQYGKYRLSGPHGGTRNSYNGFRPEPCNTWDCVALGIDAGAFGYAITSEASFWSTPVTTIGGISGFTYGKAMQVATTTAAVGWSYHQYENGNATQVDLAVTLTTSALGSVPLPTVGVIAAGGQLLYDLTVPAHPW